MRKIAVDTNILSRLLADTSSEEGKYAEELLTHSVICVQKTVLLETEWVLRSVLKLNRVEINQMLQSMLDLPRIEIEDRAMIVLAIGAHHAGMDFADAVHVTGSAAADVFVTFDRNLVKSAKRYISEISVELAQ